MTKLHSDSSTEDETMLQAPPSIHEQPARPSQREEPPAARRRSSPEHRRGLLLIGLFKLSKATLSVLLGVGALKLLHKDIAAIILHVADVLRLDPENRLVGTVLSKALQIEPAQLRHFSILTFTYAGLCLVEGTGLMLQKRWAEYFTVTLTTLALPWECFELYKEFTPARVALLVANLLVLAYLVWLLRRDRRRQPAECET